MRGKRARVAGRTARRDIVAALLVLLLGLRAGRVAAADCNENGIEDEADLAGAASEDCNGNGKPDECEGIPVDLGLGPQLTSVASLPYVLAAGDLDGDGASDLVTVSRDRGNSTLTAALNAGGRDFRVVAEYSVDGRVEGVALGDLDGDGVADLAAIVAERLLILTGVGDGSFGVPDALSIGAPAYAIAIGDLDSDGERDLLLDDRRGGSLRVLLNRGDGEYGPATELAVGEGPRGFLIVDLDVDGNSDIALVHRESHSIGVLRGLGAGRFAPVHLRELSGDYGYAIAARDLDGDDVPDLVAATRTSVSVFLGLGDGSFPTEEVYPPLGSEALALGDFNVDGAIDVALAVAPGSVLLRVNDGAGGFHRSVETGRLSSVPTALAAGDFDADDRLDLAMTTLRPSGVQFLWSGENAALSVRTERIPIENCRNAGSSGCEPHSGALADFDGDGDLDVVAAIARPGLLSIALNVGGRLVLSGEHSFGGSLPVYAKSADFDRDGKVDVATVDNAGTLFLHRGGGDGTFESASYPVGGGAFGLELGDLDGDGDLDAVVASPRDLSFLLNDGNGLFVAAEPHRSEGARDVAGGDFDGDGDFDLAVADSASLRLVVVENLGAVTFADAATCPLVSEPNSMISTDLNDDGRVDVVTANTSSSTVAILLGTGRGTFVGPIEHGTGHGPYSVDCADFDGNGLLDLITASEGKSTISVLLGSGDGALSQPSIFRAGEALRYALAGDLDADGAVDVVTIDRGGRSLTALYNETPQEGAGEGFVEEVCTAADFHDLSRPASATSAADRFLKFTLPVGEDAALSSTLFQDTVRFPLHEDFLRAVFPSAFPDLDPQSYDALVGRRATRQYFVGTISRLRTGAGIAYGVSLFVDWRDAKEALAASEVGEVLARLGDSFRPEPLVYFPNTRDASEAAEAWDDAELELRGFQVVFDSGGQVSFEPYTKGVGYGRLRILDEDAFDDANETGQLSFRDVLVLDFAPRDIEGVVSGVLTADPQGELSHLSVRTGRRGTPNAFVRNAPTVLSALADTLVRLEVTDSGYTIEEAELGEAELFWESNRPTLSEVPTLDAEFSELSSLDEIGALDGVPGSPAVEARFGGKASNLARLQTILRDPPYEQYQERGFAIPVRYYIEFARANRIPSGLTPETLVTYEQYLTELESNERFQSDSTYRFERLEALRDHMEDESTVDPDLVARLTARIDQVFGTTVSRVRFRSSSNVEDAVEFSGAGLYRSLSVCAADDLDGDGDGPSLCDAEREGERGIARGLRRVWASLWNFRAYEERAFFGIAQDLSAMGVLVNRAFIEEGSNGVAFTGNPSNGFDRRYVITAQVGEESVVSPEPGTLAEKDIVDVQDGELATPPIRAVRSSLLPAGSFVLDDDQLAELGALLWHMDQNFPLATGDHRRDEVLLDIEFKFEATGELAVKQVRGFLLHESGPPPPTFQLMIPKGTSACGTYDIARELRSEYEAKSTVRLKPGTIQLPSGSGSFAAELVDELVVGPDRQLATPDGPGIFSTTRLASGNGEVIYRFEYEQDFVLEGGDGIRFSLVQLSFRVRDGEPFETTVVLDDDTLTDGVLLRAVRNRGGMLEDIAYTSCSQTGLPRWEVRATLADHVMLTLEERHRPELERDFGPASLHSAEIQLAGASRETNDYWELVYSAKRHNLRVAYWIGLEPPVELKGLVAPVRFIELRAPSPTDGLEAVAAYLGPDLEVLATSAVVSFERREKTLVAEPLRFLRGDVAVDGRLDVTDALSLLNFLFQRGPPPRCRKGADADDNGKLHLSDAIAILLAVSGRAGPLDLLERDCAEDPTPDALDCVAPCR